jgi:hypothetical protein
VLNLPPFPSINLESHRWVGKEVLDAWVGYSAPDSGEEPGEVEVVIPRVGRLEPTPRPPTPEQVAAYAYLKDHEVELRDKILATMLKMVRDHYDFSDLENSDELPKIESLEELQTNMQIQGILVHEYAKDGYAYIGISFVCTWDEEHGAGVLLHRDRIVEYGTGDTTYRFEPILEDSGEELV